MRRVRRIAVYLLLMLVLVAAGAAALIASRQDQIVRIVLSAVKDRTGVEIVPRASSIHLRNHLVVVLESPQVSARGQRFVKLKSIRVAVGYHSILFSNGLPLYSITAEEPEFSLAVNASRVSAAPIPRPGPDAVAAIREALRSIGRIAWRLELDDARFDYADGTPIADRVDLLVYRRHHGGDWNATFDGSIMASPIAGAHAAGRVKISTSENPPANRFAHTQLWIWGVPIEGVEAEGFSLAGEMHGSLTFDVHPNGTGAGAGDAEAQSLQLSGPRLPGPVRLDDLSMHAAFSISDGKYSVSEITLSRANTHLASAATQLSRPASENPTLGVNLGGIHLDAGSVKHALADVRHLPHELVDALHRLRSGQVNLNEATLTAAFDQLKTSPLETIRSNLNVAAAIQDAGVSLPPETQLPPIEHFNAELRYAQGMLSLTQGGANFGKSVLRDVSGSVDFTKGIEGAAYKFQATLDADLAELSPALMTQIDRRHLNDRANLQRLAGRLLVSTTASGRLSVKNPALPAVYSVAIKPKAAVVMLKDSPGPITATGGGLIISPDGIEVDRLSIAATGGDAVVDGEVDFASHNFQVHKIAIDLNHFPAQLWTAMVMDPSDLGIRGLVGGRVTLEPDLHDPGLIDPEGRLTLTSGEVQFNFLRAPIVVPSATFSISHGAITLAMPGAKLQGSPIDFRLGIPDFRHPTVRIDAVVDNLNLEVMKFIRLPWSPATPPIRFTVPVSGHVDARKGHLVSFEMTNVKTDFTRNPNGDWHVYNLDAIAYGGRMKLEISGRGPDNWIHIHGIAADINPTPVFALAGPNHQSPLDGHVSLSADLWANADTNFFKTLAGDISMTARDGTLNKFSLFSKLLGYIDIKNWLTANIPDPRSNGIPFDTMMGDFKGKSGEFYTDNFVLKGKVMDITASGVVRFGEGTVDLQVGMFPFDTVDWVLNNIPLIGSRIGAGTGKLVAAYFQVSGPVSDPSITPKPITSVTEFVMKTLGMPINLIRPNTIK